MKSVQELRKICQSTRPSIFDDALSRLYYFFSIYLTKFFIALGVSSNFVTTISGLFAVGAGICLAAGGLVGAVSASVCLIMFALLDMCDGEVARYHKSGSMNGHFYDWLMHFVVSMSVAIGFAFNVLQSDLQNFYILFVLLYCAQPVVDKGVQSSAWTIICWSHLRNKSKSSNSANETLGVSSMVSPRGDAGRSATLLLRSVRLLKFCMTAPTQEHWWPITIPLTALVFFSTIGGPETVYSLTWVMYNCIVGLIITVRNAYSLVTSERLAHGYENLISPNVANLPKDDFV